MVVFSRIQTLQFDALKVVAVAKFYIIETTKNILGKSTRMGRKSEIPGGLTGGGAWGFGIDWHITQGKIVHLPESMLIIFLYYVVLVTLTIV